MLTSRMCPSIPRIFERFVFPNFSTMVLWRAYWELARLHVFPLGTILIFWPCAWTLMLASPSHLTAYEIAQWTALLGLGSIFLHAAICVLNDICDIEIDRQVERTRNRPLVAGRISIFSATKRLQKIDLEPSAKHGILAVFLLHTLYPMMKRWTWWPQAWLGLAMNYGVWVTWYALKDRIEGSGMQVFFAGLVCWSIFYDTIYACQDREADAKAGAKSTAILFGTWVKPILTCFALAFLSSLVYVGYCNGKGLPYYAVSCGGAIAHVTWQLATVDLDNGDECNSKFRANNNLGRGCDHPGRVWIALAKLFLPLCNFLEVIYVAIIWGRQRYTEYPSQGILVELAPMAETLVDRSVNSDRMERRPRQLQLDLSSHIGAHPRISIGPFSMPKQPYVPLPQASYTANAQPRNPECLTRSSVPQRLRYPDSAWMELFQDSLRPIALSAGLLCISLIVFVRWRRSQGLPPSPRGGLPLIGHLYLVPQVRAWVWFDTLSRQLNSPIIYLNLAGQDTIVINDYDIAVELLEKRSSVYSSRPRLVLAGDYVGSGKRILTLPYGPEWRRHRVAVHQETVHSKIESYTRIQVAEARLLMRKLLHDPSSFVRHLQQYPGNVLLKLTYGLNSDDPKTQKAVTDVNQIMVNVLPLATPGNLVDAFPILDRLPNILAPWRSEVLRQQANNQKVYKDLLHDVLDRVDSGMITPEQSFASRIWNDRERLEMDELDVAHLAGSLFEAGTETTSSSLVIFIMAMVSHPQVFKTVQDEVTRVCGNQPPSTDNFEALEYVRATCKEVLRWRTVVVMGFPHKSSATKDDIFMGYVIPAGSVIIANQWGMALSEKTFGQKYDPQIFEPRRWLERPGGVGEIAEGVGEIAEEVPAFGFGRRACPGRDIAGYALFVAICHICYYFDVEAMKGAPVVDTSIEGFTTG
ncbi:hypothetical protein EVG20_g7005 [Dentipellis fragilis]|uniref:Uncharacterized protein n=1 Tax=Dentipellis fragilis TaxID=205917 RepID=A0A4Y9YIA9_9AGAM|nr:hypothetical protein EVG20_g7005 [Dentipellis fragilis]